MLTSVPIPSTGGINFHTIESFSSTSSEVTHPNFSDINAAGVMTHLINIKTNFVYVKYSHNSGEQHIKLHNLIADVCSIGHQQSILPVETPPASAS